MTFDPFRDMRDAVPSEPPPAVAGQRAAPWMGAVFAVAMVILGVASLWISNHLVTDQPSHSATLKLPEPTPSLTIRHANDLLATAPSYKAVMNELAFPPKSSSISKDKTSALAVLSKEKIKL